MDTEILEEGGPLRPPPEPLNSKKPGLNRVLVIMTGQ